jgi:hypothetical protein
LTGLWLTVPTVVGLFSAERRYEMSAERYAWSTAPELEPMLAEARTRFPGSELDFLSLPRWPGEHFTLVLLDRDRWFWDKFVEITFDGETGAVRQVQASADADWLMKVNLLMLNSRPSAARDRRSARRADDATSPRRDNPRGHRAVRQDVRNSIHEHDLPRGRWHRGCIGLGWSRPLPPRVRLRGHHARDGDARRVNWPAARLATPASGLAARVWPLVSSKATRSTTCAAMRLLVLLTRQVTSTPCGVAREETTSALTPAVWRSSASVGAVPGRNRHAQMPTATSRTTVAAQWFIRRVQ